MLKSSIQCASMHSVIILSRDNGKPPKIRPIRKHLSQVCSFLGKAPTTLSEIITGFWSFAGCKTRGLILDS